MKNEKSLSTPKLKSGQPVIVDRQRVKTKNNFSKDGNTYLLIIWEEVPESTSLYLIPSKDLTKEEVDTFHLCHGHFINLVDTPEDAEKALQEVNLWLSPGYVSKDLTEPEGKFHKYKIHKEDGYLRADIKQVVLCGFML
jgi:hypothetical protein